MVQGWGRLCSTVPPCLRLRIRRATARVLCNGRARPGHPGQLRSGTARRPAQGTRTKHAPLCAPPRGFFSVNAVLDRGKFITGKANCQGWNGTVFRPPVRGRCCQMPFVMPFRQNIRMVSLPQKAVVRQTGIYLSFLSGKNATTAPTIPSTIKICCHVKSRPNI